MGRSPFLAHNDLDLNKASTQQACKDLIEEVSAPTINWTALERLFCSKHKVSLSSAQLRLSFALE